MDQTLAFMFMSQNLYKFKELSLACITYLNLQFMNNLSSHCSLFYDRFLDHSNKVFGRSTPNTLDGIVVKLQK
jgi:hypothetical protein